MLSRILALLAASACLAPTSQAVPHNASYPLHVSDDHRHFVTSDGGPFFWQADTAWALFHRLTIPEATKYLDDRAAKGFNVVLSVALIMFGPTDPSREGYLPLIDLDVTKPNETYWQHVDEVYQLAWERGIRIAMVPAWGYYWHQSDNSVGFDNVSITAENGYAFGQWFGARYPDSPYLLMADTNPVWTNKTAVSSNYALGGVQPEYTFDDYMPVADAVSAGLQDGSGAGNSALITLHPTNQWFTGTPLALASAFADDRHWLTLDTSQSGHADYPPNPPIEWWDTRSGYKTVEIMYANDKVRPVLDNEPHYEARYNNGKPDRPYWNSTDIRRGSFQAVFAGAAGVTYGADSIMQIYVPGVYEPANSGPNPGWEEELGLPGSSQVGNVAKVITERKAYPYFVPDNSFLRGDLGQRDNATMALRAADSSAILVYAPTGNQIELDVSCLPDGFATLWFDPVDGSYIPSEGSDGASVDSVATFSPPQNETHTDWVLILEA